MKISLAPGDVLGRALARAVLGLLFGLALAAPVAAQTEATEAEQVEPRVRQTWVAGGFGGGFSTEDARGLVSLEVTHVADEQLFMFAAGGVFDFFGDAIGGVEFLYGRARSEGSFHSHAAIGVAFTEDNTESGVGIPVRLGVSWRTPVLGIGFRTLANVSTVGSYLGFAVVLEIGDLR